MQTETTSIKSPAGFKEPGRSARPASDIRTQHIRRWIIAATMIVSTIFLLVTAGVVMAMRERVLDDKKQQYRNLALVLAEQLDRSFQSIELVQQAVTADIARLAIRNDADFKRLVSTPEFHDSLVARTVAIPHISGLTIRNVQGDLINSSFGLAANKTLSPNPGEYFITYPDVVTKMGVPTTNEKTGQLNFYISRRLTLGDGTLIGYINGTTQLDYYERYFQSIILGDHSAIALFRDDGTLLVRYPRDEGLIGKQMPAVAAKILSQSTMEIRQNSPIDGQDKLLAARQLPHYPVHVIVTSTVEEALTLWRETVISILIASATVLALAASFAFLGIKQLSSAVDSQSMQFTSAINNMANGLVIMDTNRRLVVANESFARMYGLPQRMVQPGVRLDDIIEYRVSTGALKVDPDTYLDQLLARLTGEHDEYMAQSITGRTIQVVNEPIPGGGFLSTHEDVTERRLREESFKLLFENNPVSMWVYDRKTQSFLAVNDAAVAQYGYGHEEFLKLSVHDIRPASSRESYLSFINTVGVATGDNIWQHQRKDGSLFEVRVYSHALEYEGHEATLVAAIDVTEQREAERRIAYIAHHDKLTDLPNRSSFDEHFLAAIKEAGESGKRLAVMCLDLDGFKQVNDLKGHSAGDVVLREIAMRLRNASEGAYLARFGGDEFTLICTDSADGLQSKAVADRLIAAVGQDLMVDGQRVNVGLSIGIALFPAHGTEAASLLLNADLALYRAKQQKRGTAQYFNSSMDAMVRERRAMVDELRRAIPAGELSLHYQPQVSIDRETVGFEALVRWKSEKFGNVSPATFIPLAEESDLIIELGDWILREACREAASWTSPLTIAVNISPRQFQQVDLPKLVQTVLLETGLPASRLELEITEGVLIDDFSRALAVLRRLKNLGVDIALDDFGTGYSSLSYLHSFAFDRIKIDRTFVMDLEQNRHSRAIVRAVVGLGQSLSIPILAEGVETETQFAFLRREGCQYVQGYLTGRPMPASDLFAPPQPVLKEVSGGRR